MSCHQQETLRHFSYQPAALHQCHPFVRKSTKTPDANVQVGRYVLPARISGPSLQSCTGRPLSICSPQSQHTTDMYNATALCSHSLEDRLTDRDIESWLRLSSIQWRSGWPSLMTSIIRLSSSSSETTCGQQGRWPARMSAKGLTCCNDTPGRPNDAHMPPCSTGDMLMQPYLLVACLFVAAALAVVQGDVRDPAVHQTGHVGFQQAVPEQVSARASQ